MNICLTKYFSLLCFQLFFPKKVIRNILADSLPYDWKCAYPFSLDRNKNKNERQAVAAHLCWQAVKPSVPDINWIIHWMGELMENAMRGDDWGEYMLSCLSTVMKVTPEELSFIPCEQMASNDTCYILPDFLCSPLSI